MYGDHFFLVSIPVLVVDLYYTALHGPSFPAAPAGPGQPASQPASRRLGFPRAVTANGSRCIACVHVLTDVCTVRCPCGDYFIEQCQCFGRVGTGQRAMNKAESRSQGRSHGALAGLAAHLRVCLYSGRTHPKHNYCVHDYYDGFRSVSQNACMNY